MRRMYTTIIITKSWSYIYIYKIQILLTNYKHTQPTLGLSVTFVFNIEYIFIFNKREHTYIYYKINRTHWFINNNTQEWDPDTYSEHTYFKYIQHVTILFNQNTQRELKSLNNFNSNMMF